MDEAPDRSGGWESQALSGWVAGGWHHLRVRIYYEDTDFSGLVYHANYLRYLERGRSDCLRLAGVNHAELWALEEPLAFAIRRMDITFVAPARIDDVLTVRTRFTQAFGARIEAEQVILRGETEILRAGVSAACINGDGRPRRLPGTIRDRMAAMMDQD